MFLSIENIEKCSVENVTVLFAVSTLDKIGIHCSMLSSNHAIVIAFACSSSVNPSGLYFRVISTKVLNSLMSSKLKS